MYKSNTNEQLFWNSSTSQVIKLPILGDCVYDFLGSEVSFNDMYNLQWLPLDESDYLGLPDTY